MYMYILPECGLRTFNIFCDARLYQPSLSLSPGQLRCHSTLDPGNPKPCPASPDQTCLKHAGNQGKHWNWMFFILVSGFFHDFNDVS